MQYDHKQYGIIHWILFGIGILDAVIMLVVLQFVHEPIIYAVIGFSAFLFITLGYLFQYLHVYDDGQGLQIQFGPLKLFYTNIEYKDIEEVEIEKSPWIAGIGYHFIRNGKVLNIKGRDCVKITLKNGKLVYVGSDQTDELKSFIDKMLLSY